MIRSIRMSLKIDRTYKINSFIYVLRKLPILKDLFTEDIYKSKVMKSIVRVLSIIFSICKNILFRALYFLIIYYICTFICSKNISNGFIHVYFIFSIIGMFINNKGLVTSTKKYYSIILFGMDAKKYYFGDLFLNIITSFILNIIGFIVLCNFISLPIYIGVLLSICSLLFRVSGEMLDLAFYKRFGYFWYNKTGIYFIILGILLVISCLPYFGIFVSNLIILISILILFIFSIYALIYLIKFDGYKLLYKRLNTQSSINTDSKSYSRQEMVSIRDKDKLINSKKLIGKKGYDLLNTIFFERHREILSRSARNYSFIILGVYVFIIFMCIVNDGFASGIHSGLLNNLGYFVIFMYFINRGSIITQAMFMNCDHALLTYNFYREPKVLLGLFKKRVLTVSKVNLVPAVIIAIGNVILLYMTGGTSLITYISSFIFIILLSVFFSVHYLVIYYLLQPFNKNMEVKKISYSIVTILTYYFSYLVKDVVVSSLLFSVLGVIFTVVYLLISLLLVKRLAPRTFKLN